jgi:hypothetical protein
MCYLQEIHFGYKDRKLLKAKEWKMYSVQIKVKRELGSYIIFIQNRF